MKSAQAAGKAVNRSYSVVGVYDDSFQRVCMHVEAQDQELAAAQAVATARLAGERLLVAGVFAGHQMAVDVEPTSNYELKMFESKVMACMLEKNGVEFKDVADLVKSSLAKVVSENHIYQVSNDFVLYPKMDVEEVFKRVSGLGFTTAVQVIGLVNGIDKATECLEPLLDVKSGGECSLY